VQTQTQHLTRQLSLSNSTGDVLVLISGYKCWEQPETR